MLFTMRVVGGFVFLVPVFIYSFIFRVACLGQEQNLLMDSAPYFRFIIAPS